MGEMRAGMNERAKFLGIGRCPLMRRQTRRTTMSTSAVMPSDLWTSSSVTRIGVPGGCVQQ